MLVKNMDVRCVTTSRTDYGSVHVCAVLEDGKEVDAVNFRIVKRGNRKVLIPEGDSEFNHAFFMLFGGKDLSFVTRGRQSEINRNLEFLVKQVLESGYWKPKTKSKGIEIKT